ncbi:MAG: transglycosylase SLT domain-containing protein [Legionellaceae bacterium]|nr:transglycosylase SLT domain-containing protein [Legionellaceae bacterium]
MKQYLFMVIALTGFITACVKNPPHNVNHACHIFSEYPQWYQDTSQVEKTWRVSTPVQLAIIHQESSFQAHAQPPRTTLFGIIPWKHVTSAYGYSQALNGTWAQYKRSRGGWFASRNNFGDATDFIGWYANQANRLARIPRNDAYALYLAYHEGIGGYQRKTYLKKPWLIRVARKVKARAEMYRAQMNRCHF